jgi:hypothetical protein
MPQFWAGFVDDKIHTEVVTDFWGEDAKNTYRAPMLFTSREQARWRFEDVRKVEVRVVSKKK